MSKIVKSNSDRSLLVEEFAAANNINSSNNSNLTLKSAKSSSNSSVSRNSYSSNTNYSIAEEDKPESDDDLIDLQREDSIPQISNTNNSLAQYYYKYKTSKMAEEHAQKEDEDFQKKLIDEVLGKDAGDKVSMEKVVMIIWQFRDDKDVIKFMTRFVCKVRRVLQCSQDRNEIEP